MQSNLGESWARPAISYWLENDHIEDKVHGIVTLAAGYPLGSGGSQEGRYLGILDAVTGDVIDHFSVAAPNASDVYETDFGLVSDTAVASQCISRYWGEAQEMYFNDPAGRLFRLDINKNMDHENTWAGAPSGVAQQLTPVFTFPACQSTGATCSITGDKNDVFSFSPAVAAVNRIDEVASESGVINEQSNDRYLVAMASGSLHDDATDGGDPDNDFHSSLYIIADNHNGAQGEDPTAGILIPNSGARTAPGTDPNFARVVLTDLERTRTFTPFDGDTVFGLSTGEGEAVTPSVLLRLGEAASQAVETAILTGR